ncbi:MAG: deoxyuridine 5'-triphosphate nucleotidohydrolase [Candidatus Thorarchaeota archaeon]
MTKKSTQQDEEFSAIYMENFKDIISEEIDFEKQKQVNGFDLSVQEIYSLVGEGAIDFDNSKRVLPEYQPLKMVNNEYWQLTPGSYVIRYNEVVSVPLNAVGIIQPRSTLLRMGAHIVGAWWDSGYSGRGQGLLITTQNMKMYKNARVAQIVFIISKKVHTGYEGKYQNEAK